MKINNIIKIFSMAFLLIFGGTSLAFAADDFDYSALTETLLNQDPDPVEPGDYVEIRFKIEKEGNKELKDIKYELVPEFPFSFDNSDFAIKSLNDWNANSDSKEYYTLYYKLKVDENALDGTYELTLYQTASNQPGKKEIKFNIRVDERKQANLVIGLIETLPRKLVADYDEGKLEIEIVNTGDDLAENVIVNLNLPEGFSESYGYSNIANLGSIEAGMSKKAVFYVDTYKSLNSNSYPTTLEIQYSEDEDGSKNSMDINLDLDLKIFGKPKYEIKYLNEKQNFYPGQNAQIKLNIKNIGSKKSESTSIQIFKDSSQPFEFEDKTDYLGKIEVGDSSEGVFSFSVDKNAIAKEYKLDVQIRTIIDNEVIIEEKTIIIPVSKNSNSSLLKIEYILGLLIILGSFLGFHFGKKYSMILKK